MLGWFRRRYLTPQVGSRLLRDMDETLVLNVAHHWIVYVRPALWIAGGLALWATVPFTRVEAGWFPMLAGTVLLLIGAWRALTQHMDRFVVTNMRAFRVKGIVAQSAATMPLARVLDITVKKPVLGRLLGYGHFVFESAAQEQGLHRIEFVPRPDRLDLLIQEQVQRAGLRGKTPV